MDISVPRDRDSSFEPKIVAKRQRRAQVEQMMVPFARQRQLLETIPGLGPTSAAAILAEIGASPDDFFADGAHLASWAGGVSG